MKTILLTVLSCLAVITLTQAQPCTPQGNPSTYGTGNVWIGYVYDNADLSSYSGYVTEGSVSSPNFDQSFGGDNVAYSTNGCPVQTETFSVRYRLTQSFTTGYYEITVGADDGYRLSIDGGATWVIDRWNDQSYTTTNTTVQLSGSHNLVLEYYENGGGNRVSFNIIPGCAGTENTSIYGTGNTWRGYVYDGTNFELYRGMMTIGNSTTAAFDESFGGSYTTFNTTSCTGINTETFSVRFRLTKYFAPGQYVFFVGGDDGYRLSVDGGHTWIIDRWFDQSYNMNTYNISLNGSYNLVLEYYENGGDNRLNFYVDHVGTLPITLMNFTGTLRNDQTILNWQTTSSSNPDYFDIERSVDGIRFETIARIDDTQTNGTNLNPSFSYTDVQTPAGKTFYRLKMTDQTAVVTYSGVVTINQTASTKTPLRVYPTVVSNGSLTILPGQTLEKAQLSILDLNGRIIIKKQQGRMTGGHPVSFETGHLHKGMYLLQVADKGEAISTTKFIVQ